MTKKLLRGLAPVLALSLVLGMTACGSKTEETAAQETKAEQQTAAAKDVVEETAKSEDSASAKDTLVIATANETPSMTTNLHNATAGDYMNKMTHNGLFLYDENMAVQPDLVESYEAVSDNEWIFKLYQGVKFHNGMELTAKDVKASLEQTKESPEVAQYSTSYTSVEVVDDYTVKIITDGPQASLLGDLAHHGNFILPAELIESGHDFNKEPIGTGPYKFVEWNKGESVVFEAFEDYFKGEAPIKNVIWKIIPEGSSRTMALEAGEIDLIIEVETTDVSRMKDNPDITVFDEAGTGYNYMMMNNEIAPFNNVNFRRALSAAIDREAMIQVALSGAGSPSYALVPECFPGATAEGAPTYDPEAAKAYLEESGLNPAEWGFAIICSDDTKLRAGQVIQSSLKENLGIDVTLESMDLATYMDVTTTGDYQAAIGGYTTTNMMSYAKGVFHSNSINASNKTRTNDPEVDAIIDKMLVTVDTEENTAVATEFSKKMNELCPHVPMYLKNNTRAYSADLKGFNCGASGTTYYEQFSW